MPIYAYRCSACGHAKDVLQKMSDPLLSTCPACGAETLVKQVTAAGFQLKGSGWYVTDFKSSGAAPAPAPAVAGGAVVDAGAAKPTEPGAPASADKAAATSPGAAPAAPAAAPVAAAGKPDSAPSGS